MKKAKVIITLQVLFLAVTIIFSTGIAYNGAGGQDTPPVDAATNLAIRQQGLEVADPARNQFQAQLASMDAMLRALKEVSQGRIPAGAQEMQGIPGAFLVPFTVDAQQGASQATKSALVVMSRDEIQGLQKDSSLSALRQGVNVYLPAISKASSAGLFANPLAELNKELASLGITDRSQSTKIGNRVVAITSNVNQGTGLMNVTVSISSTFELYTGGLLINLADKASNRGYTHALDVNGATTFTSLPVSEYGITVMRPKSSSSGQQTIALNNLTVLYGESETMDRLLALPANADLSHQIRSLELLGVYDLVNAVDLYSTGAKIRLFTGRLDHRLGSDGVWVLAQARVADEAGVVAERQLLMHMEQDNRPLTIYPVISTSPLAKTSSAGLVDVTVANRVFSVDTQAAVQLRAEHPILEEHLKHLGTLLSENMSIETVNDGLSLLLDADKEGLTPTLEWVGTLELGITPETFFYTVNAQLGDETTQLLIKRIPLNEVMRANKDIPASTPGAFVIVNEKASSAGFIATSIAQIDDFNYEVTSLYEQLKDIAAKPVADQAEAVAKLQALLGTAQALTGTQLQQLQSFLARESSSLAAAQVQEAVKGEIAAQHLRTAIEGAVDAAALIQQISTFKELPKGVTPAVVEQALDIYVEQSDAVPMVATEFQKAMSTRAFSQKHNRELTELEAVNLTANCKMQAKSIAEIPALTPDNTNAFAIATTEQGLEALRAKGYENAVMLRDLIQGNDLNLLSLAAFAKGRYLSSIGVVDGSIKGILSRAYFNLTGQSIPSRYLEPGTFIIEVTLRPVNPVYADGELEDLHMMRLLALIAA